MLRENRLTYIASAAALTFSFLPTSGALAQQATYLSDQASYCEIFQAINPEVPERCRTELGGSPRGLGMARSIELHKKNEDVTGRALAADQDGPREIAMNIRFEFDSAKLTPEAMDTLDRVAMVLNSEIMANKAIVVEGHTDSIGGEDYNLSLSTQRALAVQFYLVDQHLIDMDRLQITGKGESELYDPDHPKSPLNRRVEFTNLNS